MAALAEATGSVSSAVMLGALAGSGALPFPRMAFEAAIRRGQVGVKASLAATYRIADPQRAILGTDDFRTAAYTELQLALRAIISEHKVEDLLQQRAEFSTRLKALPAANLTAIGLELQDAALRDLTLPGELKKIFSQVVKARQEGLAALERALALEPDNALYRHNLEQLRAQRQP